MILVTGGTGYIGSHTCVELHHYGYQVIVIDNLQNSKLETIKRIEKITGKRPLFYHIDLLNKKSLEDIFCKHPIDSVIHFAGLKSINESIEHPIKYYQNNVIGTINLCEIMNKYHVKKLVFSSSATVYGENNKSPLTEQMPLNPTNPYGNTKWVVETFLKDLSDSNPDWSIALLRYFNPAGAHSSGQMGEDPLGTPNNLLPLISQVATGKREQLSIYGTDYNTPDGTGVRDYVHVMDIAKGHVKALEWLDTVYGIHVFNLGSGKGYSVMEVIRTFEKVTGTQIKFSIADRRKGDVRVCYADVSKAFNQLGWKAENTLEDICRDAWKWAKNVEKKRDLLPFI